VHNYAKYSNAVIGSPQLPPQALGDLWKQIAMRYKDNSLIIFGLMNEPVELRGETWLEAANIAIENIRRTGAKNLILVPGIGWTSAHGWMSWKYGTPNSEVMLRVFDPGRNFAYDVHQYFDSDYSGTNPECQSTEVGVAALKVFTQWARYHHKRGFLGEFGAGPNQTCLEALDNTLNYMAGNSTVWLGWTYWAGGTGWPEDFFSSLEPIEGQDRPQMKVLGRYTRYVPSVRGDEK
jgi:endoglucanase